MVGGGGDIKTKAAFTGFHTVGKRRGELFTGIDPVRHIGAVQHPAIANIDHIESLIARGLTEVADGKDVRSAQQTFFLQFVITGPRGFKRLAA